MNNTMCVYDTPRWKPHFLHMLFAAFAFIVVRPGGAAQGQIVNGDFESACVGSFISDAFQTPTSCVTGSWFVSHGTPDIKRNIGGNTSASAYMWSSGAAGEGLFVECPEFEEGVTYKLSFRYYASYDLTSFYVALSNDLVHSNNKDFGTGYFVPAVSSEVVYNDPLVYATWHTVTAEFTPTANYSQLWFYSQSTEGNIHLDDVDVKMLCRANVTYTSFSGTPAFTERGDFIQASGTSAVSSGQTITYKAGNYVRLLPDFHANPGAGSFHAYIEPCSTEEDIEPCTDNTPPPKRGDFHEGYGSAHKARLVLDNAPNPFTGKTVVSYAVGERGPVTLTVVDMLGVQVAEIVSNSNHSAGRYSMEFDASGLTPGVYYLRLAAGTSQVVRKMVIAP